jgi:hypothetical protein
MRGFARWLCAIGTGIGLALPGAAAAHAAAGPGSSRAVPRVPVAVAAKPRAWRISYTTRSASVYLGSIAAPGKADAWVVGSYRNARGQSRPLVLHWNGARWSPYVVPGLGPHFTAGLVEATSPGDVWIFVSHPVSGGGTAAEEFHFDGTGWNAVPAPPFSSGSDPVAAVLGGSDVWESSGGDCTDSSAPYCSNLWNWNGAIWTSTQVPTALSGLAAAGGHVWLVGEHDVSASTGYGRPQIFTWTGLRWSYVAGPYGRVAIFPAIAASPRGELWLESASRRRPRIVIYHWNGSAWSHLVPPATLSGQPVIIPGDLLAYDAHQGVWLGGTMHWDGSRWINTARVAIPTSESGLVQFYVAPEPGTFSTWGIGNGWFCAGTRTRCDRDFIARIGRSAF